MLVGILGAGFLPVANAKVLWIKADGTGQYYCPDVCKVTKRFHPKHSKFNVPYAVPSSTHPQATKARKEQIFFYVCASVPPNLMANGI